MYNYATVILNFYWDFFIDKKAGRGTFR